MTETTEPAAYFAALGILSRVEFQMLSRSELHRRGVSDPIIDAAIARGDAIGDCGALASIILTVDGESQLKAWEAANNG